jgi:uncharacterized protein involved in exopolysaccharide biosynthesis
LQQASIRHRAASTDPIEHFMVAHIPAIGTAQGEHSDLHEATICLSDLVQFVFASKLLIVSGAVLGVALAATLSHFTTPVYRAYAVMIRSDSGASSMQDALSGGLGQVAAFAGLSGRPARGEAEAGALLQSRDTIGSFIDSNNLVPLLLAGQWDATAKRWKKNDITEEERRQLAISVFTRRVLNVERERLTGIMTLTIDWRDRHQAADWANGLVATANALWRQQVIDEAAQSIQYLTRELENTNTLEVRDAVYRLIESSMKQRTVATVRRDLLFKVLDKARPLRNAGVGFVLGTIFGAFVAFVRLLRR